MNLPAKAMLAAAVALAWGGCVFAAQTPSTMQVVVTGEVAHAQRITFTGQPRLADLAKVAGVRPDAYVLGAAWLRPSLLPAQRGLKAGLMYELGAIDRQAMASDRDALSEVAVHLRRQLAAMPVTGRQVGWMLEPHALQIDPAANVPLADGDRLQYPSRPATITVMGAVAKPCILPQLPLKPARRYLDGCVLSAVADPDDIYVIQPDGRVFKRGVALWNRDPALALAPGAVIYVPLKQKAIAPVADNQFNHDMAAFIATQPLPAGASR